MRDDDRASLIRHCLAGCKRINIERIQIDIDEGGLRPDSLRRKPRRRTDITWHDDFVTGSDPERPQRQLERRSSGTDGYPPLQTNERGHVVLESLDPRPLGNLPGTKHLDRRLQVFLVDRRP